jgi:heptosyltransferase-2
MKRINKEKILIIKIGALGDVAIASTMLAPLKEKYPNSHITWLCGDDLIDLVRNFPEVDRIITVPRAFVSGTIVHKIIFSLLVWIRVAFSSFDLCILAQQGRRYRNLPVFISAKKFRYLSGRNGLIPGRYRGADYARLADGSDRETDKPPVFPKINFGQSIYPRSVLLFPGGAYYSAPFNGLRRWSMEKYRTVAARLLAKGYSVTLIGSASDKWAEKYFEGLDVVSAIGKTTINSLMALIADSYALISHDSGPMHLAILSGTPLVAVFGPTWSRDFLPGKGSFIALSSDLPCSPCYDGKYFAFSCAGKLRDEACGGQCKEPPCLAGISAQKVLDALEKLI